jgi:hypothetical protein
MQNRRQDYRHTFAPYERIPVSVEITGRRSRYVGEMVNLSIGGFCLQLHGKTAPFSKDDSCVARFQLPGEDVQLEVHSRIIHGSHNTCSHDLGIQFLPLASPVAQEKRENALWRFLMREQRRCIRRDRLDTSSRRPHLALYIPDED